MHFMSSPPIAPWAPPPFDFEAAGQLVAVIESTSRIITNTLEIRHQLAVDATTHWEGSHRESFDSQFAAAVARAVASVDSLMRLRNQVVAEIDAAHGRAHLYERQVAQYNRDVAYYERWVEQERQASASAPRADQPEDRAS
jgi:16S rRNA G527 N7-methylase RsmG